jgi:transcription antitermination factor NusG
MHVRPVKPISLRTPGVMLRHLLSVVVTILLVLSIQVPVEAESPEIEALKKDVDALRLELDEIKTLLRERVGILGERWDRLLTLRESEIETIKRLLGTGRRVLPHQFLQHGQRLRIKRGPLAGVEGILVRANPQKGLLVVSVDLLQRSVAVHLECTDLEAA